MSISNNSNKWFNGSGLTEIQDIKRTEFTPLIMGGHSINGLTSVHIRSYQPLVSTRP